MPWATSTGDKSMSKLTAVMASTFLAASSAWAQTQPPPPRRLARLLPPHPQQVAVLRITGGSLCSPSSSPLLSGTSRGVATAINCRKPIR